jgi:hypothetical protein
MGKMGIFAFIFILHSFRGRDAKIGPATYRNHPKSPPETSGIRTTMLSKY